MPYKHHSVILGLMYSVVWMIWCFKVMYSHVAKPDAIVSAFQNRQERPYVWKCSVTVMATTCFVLLEVRKLIVVIALYYCQCSYWTLLPCGGHLMHILCGIFQQSLCHCCGTGRLRIPHLCICLCCHSFLSSDAQHEVQYTMRKHI